MSNEEKKKQKIVRIVKHLVVAEFTGNPVLGILSEQCDRELQILLRDVFPIGVHQEVATNAAGVPLTDKLGRPIIRNSPRMGNFPWCPYGPLEKLYLPEDTALYFVKDLSVAARALYGTNYVDHLEALKRQQVEDREAEKLVGNLVQPAQPGDEGRVAEQARALRELHGG